MQGKRVAGAVIVAVLLALPAGAAEVKPLEVFSEKIIVREVEHLAIQHAMASALVRKSVDRLNREMNIMSHERTRESLRLLANARSTLTAAMRTSAELSSYVATSKAQLKTAGHERFLPLARLDGEIEHPYYEELERFFTTAADFVQFCNDNLDAIMTGQPEESKQYDIRYAAYLKAMDAFNARSVKRGEQLTAWANEYPGLWELLPR